MNKGGVVIFNLTRDTDIDPSFFGGLMSALNSFAKKVTSSKLESIILKDKKFHILKNKEYKFIAASQKEEEDGNIEKELNIVVDLFHEHYPPEQLANWDGNTKIFTTFEKIIEDEFLKAYKKLKTGLW